MDYKAVLYAFGVMMFVATIYVETIIVSVIGGAFMLAAMVFGWLQQKRQVKEKVRAARRENPDLHRARRAYYAV